MSASLEKTETSLLIIQTRFNYMINQHQISKFKMQPQAVYGSDISLSKATCANLGLNILKVPTYVPSDIYPCKSRRQTQTWFIISLSCDLEPEITIPKFRKIFILADLDPDLSSGLNPGRLIALVFRKTSYIDTHTSRLWLQTRFVISLSCDLEPDITMTISWNIFLSPDMDPDLSAGLDHDRGISRVLHKPFPLDLSCHDFEKAEKGWKLSSQLWIRMVGDLIYIFSRYLFSLYLISLTAYEGEKMYNKMWIHMAG